MSNKIYLIDLNGNHTILVENGSCIGREHLQNCEDKRISRKHAIFTVEANKIIITATHTNPLFYRTKSDSILKSLLKNSIVELKESDEVGFLPDKFWFRISSTKLENVASSQIDDSETQELDLNENISDPDTEEPPLPTIRIKNAAEINLLSLTLSTEVTGSSGDSQKTKRPNWMLEENYLEGTSLAKKQKTNTSDVLEDEVESTISVRDIPDNESDNLNDSTASQPVVDSNNVVSENDNVRTSNNSDEDVDNKEDIKIPGLLSSSDTPDGNDPASSNGNDPASFDGNDPASADGNDPASSDGNDPGSIDRNNAVNSVGNDAASSVGNDAASSVGMDAATNSSSTTTATQPQVPKITIKKEVKVEPADSSSVRNSCQYGIKCYRRNPAHLSELAHPGDSDYRRPNFPPAPPSSPDCPYYNACYRRNPVHFQQFKHPPSTNPKKNRRKLRKKNLDSGDSQLSGSAILGTKRDRKKLILNLDYGLSDDDESDPFDDTDDDSEFVPSDDGTDDDLPDTEDTPNDD